MRVVLEDRDRGAALAAPSWRRITIECDDGPSVSAVTTCAADAMRRLAEPDASTVVINNRTATVRDLERVLVCVEQGRARIERAPEDTWIDSAINELRTAEHMLRALIGPDVVDGEVEDG